MHDVRADDELAPVIGERYRDVLAQRAIVLLDDHQPEAPVTRSAGRALAGHQPDAKIAGG